jgi:Peptidase family M23
VVALLPVLIAFQAGAPPALAWTWPADGPVLRAFEYGKDPYAAGQHRGIDVAGKQGAPVLAPAAGVVSFAGTVPGGGRAVTVRTPDGYSVTLVHLGSVEVVDDAVLREGASVGTIGPSGDAEHTQPYVHLGIRVTANATGYLDPLSLLPTRGADPPAAPAPPAASVPTMPPVPEPEEPVPVPESAPAPEALAPPAEPPVPTPEAPAPPAEVPASPLAAPAPPAEAPVPLPEVPAPAASALAPPGAIPPPAITGVQGDGLAVAVEPAYAGRETGDRTPGDAEPARRTATPSPPGSPEILGDVGQAPAGVAATLSSPEQGASPGLLVDPIAGAAAGFLGLVALLALRRRQVVHAVLANAPAPVLQDGAGRAAEHARAPRSGEEDGFVFDGDLESIALGEPEPLPNLDGDNDSAELVQVANDACRRLPTTVALVRLRFHRVGPRPPSHCRRPEKVSIA